MQTLMSSDRVRLTAGFPELDLFAGTLGVVRNAWLYPNEAYEVEFEIAEPSGAHNCRLLLLHDQIVPE
jgi:hypothetical protein